MTWTVLLVQFQRLMHNRVELLLTFIVPIAFFSIFAMIFGGGLGSGTTPKIKVVAVDEVKSERSKNVMASLRESVGLRFVRGEDDTDSTKSECHDARNSRAIGQTGDGDDGDRPETSAG